MSGEAQDDPARGFQNTPTPSQRTPKVQMLLCVSAGVSKAQSNCINLGRTASKIIMARYFPGQDRAPMLKVKSYLSISFRFSAPISSHLSGLNSSASSPKRSLDRFNTQALMPMLVPAGRKKPSIVRPDGGARRGNGTPTTGERRMDSRSAADRYGVLVMPDCLGFVDAAALADSSSTCILSWIDWLAMMLCRKEEMVIAD
jgi:hypothetical protein